MNGQNLGRLHRALLWAAGAVEHRHFADLRTEQTRYVSLGLTLLIPPVLGMVGCWAAITTVTHNRAAGIVGGVLWAAIVFAIDRALVVSYKKHFTPPTQSVQAAARRLCRTAALFGARAAIALLVGLLIGHALVLPIYEPEIEEQLATEESAHVDDAIAPLETRRAQLHEQRSLLWDPLDELQRERQDLDRDIAEEHAGKGLSGMYGKKGVWTDLNTERENLQSDIQQREARLHREDERLERELAQIARTIEERRATAERTFATGPMARARALEHLLEESAELRRARLVLILLVLTLELLPLVVKAFIVHGPYASLVTGREDRVVEDVRCELEAVYGAHNARTAARQTEILEDAMAAAAPKHSTPDAPYTAH